MVVAVVGLEASAAVMAWAVVVLVVCMAAVVVVVVVVVRWTYRNTTIPVVVVAVGPSVAPPAALAGSAVPVAVGMVPLVSHTAPPPVFIQPPSLALLQSTPRSTQRSLRSAPPTPRMPVVRRSRRRTDGCGRRWRRRARRDRERCSNERSM